MFSGKLSLENKICNDILFSIYNILLNKLNTDERIYYGIDQAIEQHVFDRRGVHAATGGIENIHKETPSGVPPYELRLKIGSIMLVCYNLGKGQQSPGVVNGTRVQIMRFIDDNLVECRFVTGFRADLQENFILHRKNFYWDGEERGVVGSGTRKCRVQLPLVPGFVLTFTKSQGIE